MKRIARWAQQHKTLIAVVLLAAAGVFAVVEVTQAVVLEGIVDQLKSTLADIVLAFIGLTGRLITMFIYYVIDVFTYDGYATAPAVETGWVLLRDFGNLLIVVSLIIVAFASALNLGGYQLNRSLATIVGVAIVVNFSKTITLLIIDVGQVVMLSFVNAFKDIGVGNFADILGLESFFGVSNQAQQLDLVTSLAAMLFTVITMIVVLITLFVMAIIMVWRTVLLWIYIILSPIAFASLILSKKYFNNWLGKVFRYVAIGPILAFFIWLTFASLQFTTESSTLLSGTNVEDRKRQTVAAADLGTLGEYDKLAGFIIAIAMLWGGIKFSSSFVGGDTIAGELLGKVATEVRGRARAAGIGALRTPGRAAAGVGRAGVGVATSPFRVARRVFRGELEGEGLGAAAARGISERLERRRFSKYLTGAGRKEGAEYARSYVSQLFGPEARKYQTLEARKKNIANIKSTLPAEIQTEEDWNARLEDELKNKNADRFLATLEYGAEQGYINREMVARGREELRKGALPVPGTIPEDQYEKILEDSEKAFKKKTGIKVAFNKIREDETGQVMGAENEFEEAKEDAAKARATRASDMLEASKFGDISRMGDSMAMGQLVGVAQNSQNFSSHHFSRGGLEQFVNQTENMLSHLENMSPEDREKFMKDNNISDQDIDSLRQGYQRALQVQKNDDKYQLDDRAAGRFDAIAAGAKTAEQVKAEKEQRKIKKLEEKAQKNTITDQEAAELANLKSAQSRKEREVEEQTAQTAAQQQVRQLISGVDLHDDEGKLRQIPDDLVEDYKDIQRRTVGRTVTDAEARSEIGNIAEDRRVKDIMHRLFARDIPRWVSDGLSREQIMDNIKIAINPEEAQKRADEAGEFAPSRLDSSGFISDNSTRERIIEQASAFIDNPQTAQDVRERAWNEVRQDSAALTGFDYSSVESTQQLQTIVGRQLQSMLRSLEDTFAQVNLDSVADSFAVELRDVISQALQEIETVSTSEEVRARMIQLQRDLQDIYNTRGPGA